MENNIIQLRKSKGLTQEQFAVELGVSRQTIIAIEQGKFNPSLDLAFKISRLFKKRIEDIFIYSEDSQ